MTTHFTVIGAGAVGRVVVEQLLHGGDADIVVIDPSPQALAAAVECGSDRVTGILSRGDTRTLCHDDLAESACIVNAAPMPLAVPIAAALMPGGVRMIDLGPFHADTMRLFALHDLAVASKGQLVTGCGVAPGLTNLVAALGVRDFDTVKRLTINSYLVGDTFLLPSAGTDRQHETEQPTMIVRSGKPHECSEADLATLTETVDFGEHGSVTVHPISHAEPAVLAASLGIADVIFRTAHPSREDVVASFLRDNGFLDRAPVTIGTATLDTLTLSTQLFQTAGLPALNAKMIRIDGVRDGRAANAEWFISAGMRGTSATAYTSGVVAAAVALELAARPKRYGVFSPEQVLDPVTLIERVRRQAISVVGPTRPATAGDPDTRRSVARGQSSNPTTTEKESRTERNECPS